MAKPQLKKILLSILISFCCIVNTHAATGSGLNEKLAAYNKAANDSVRVHCVNIIISQYYKQNDTLSFKLMIDALYHSKSFITVFCEPDFLNKFSVINDYSYELIVDILKRNINRERNNENSRNLAISLFLSMDIKMVSGDFNKALEEGLESIRIFNRINDKEGAVFCRLVIPLIYEDIQKTKDAVKMLMAINPKEYGQHEKIVAFFKEDYLGMVYLTMNKLDTALIHLRKAATISPNQSQLAFNYIWTAQIFIEQKKFDIAINYLSRAKEIFDSPRCKSCAMAVIGLTETQIGHYGKAVNILHQAILLHTGINNSEDYRLMYAYLAKAYQLNHDFENAFIYRLKMDSVQDIIISKTALRNMEDMKSKYDSEKKDLEISASQAKYSRQRFITYCAVGVIILVLLLLILGTRMYRQKKRTAEELTIAKNKAEQSEQFKQQFLANMSHEIRTPMNAVLGMTHLTLDTQLTPKQNKYLTAIKRSSENLLVIINDILDLSKMQSGKMEMESIPFRLAEQINQVYDTMQYKAEEKGLILLTEIEDNVPQMLMGDPSRLNQILINLCGNAIKFTERGSIKIKVEKLEGTEATLCFKVIDTGIGIPANKLNQIFESFQQVDASTSRKYGGTGLGLSISRTLVMLQGGNMEVASSEGHGSEFSFTIPYTIPEEAVQQEWNTDRTTNPALLDGIRILVAEDNEYNQVVIKDTLENLIKNVNVHIASNGNMAIGMLEANDYDLILMDVNMPLKNGHETSEYIRSTLQEPKCHIPIIALTASVLSVDIDKCLEAGMNGCVRKPFRRDELLNAIAGFYCNKDGERIAETKTDIHYDMVVTHSANVTGLSFLIDFCEGDRIRMCKYIDIFLKVMPDYIENMKSALHSSDYATVYKIAHTIKAHFNFMGMVQTMKYAEQIERFTSESIHLDQIPQLVNNIKIDCEKSFAELRELRME